MRPRLYGIIMFHDKLNAYVTHAPIVKYNLYPVSSIPIIYNTNALLGGSQIY